MKRSLMLSVSFFAGLFIGWMAAPAGDTTATFAADPISGGGQTVGSKAPPPARSESHMERLFAEALVSPEDCRAALETAKALRGQEHPLLLAAVRDRALRRWLELDAEGALAFARSRPEEDVLARALMMHASEQLATAEPERALELFLERDGSSRDYENRGVLRQAFAALAASGLETGMERWATLPDAYKSDALSGILTQQFAVDQGAAVARWREWLDDPDIAPSVLPAMEIALSWGHGGGAQDLGEVLKAIPEFGANVREYVLQGWVKTDPEEAAGFIAERVRVAGGADIGEREAIAELAFSRPEFTARWLPGLPEGAFRNDAAAALALNWSHFNPAAATAWVAALPEGSMKEAASGVLGGSQ